MHMKKQATETNKNPLLTESLNLFYFSKKCWVSHTKPLQKSIQQQSLTDIVFRLCDEKILNVRSGKLLIISKYTQHRSKYKINRNATDGTYLISCCIYGYFRYFSWYHKISYKGKHKSWIYCAAINIYALNGNIFSISNEIACIFASNNELFFV